jgi:hypothetical protein
MCKLIKGNLNMKSCTKHYIIFLFLTVVAASTLVVTAQTNTIASSSDSSPWLCRALKDSPVIYDNPDSSWIQAFRILGRFQYQFAHINGTGSDGKGFTYDTDEFRRVWLGGRVKMLKYIEAEGQWILIKDGRPKGEPRTSDHQIWELFATFNAGDALGFSDESKLLAGYGRSIINMGGEWNRSSTKIKTVERSAIANKIWLDDNEASNPTGVWLDGARNGWEFTTGLFSTETSEGLADWTGGILYYGNIIGNIRDSDIKLIIDGFYQDVEYDRDTLADGVEWVTSAAVEYAPKNWTLLLDTIYGNNGEQSELEKEGDFWGVVILPSHYIWRDRLEAVMRYEYQGAENPQGASLNSRYAGRAEKKGDVILDNGGRGDRHQSIYAGFNYYICGNQLKIMTGIEYEQMKSQGTDIYDGWTFFTALRTYL